VAGTGHMAGASACGFSTAAAVVVACNARQPSARRRLTCAAVHQLKVLLLIRHSPIDGLCAYVHTQGSQCRGGGVVVVVRASQVCTKLPT
jgi:hypothetical protein